MIERIVSASDLRVAPYLNVRERDLARRDDLFVVEGRIALERLVAHGRFPLVSALVSEARLAAIEPLIENLSTPVYVAPREVMDQVAGFPIHRGVLALARRTSAIEPDEALANASLVLGLIGLSNHDNVGACFRNAAAFGADAVLLDETCCDPLYRKAIRVSSGASLSLPFTQGGTGEAMVDHLSARGFECWALSPSGGEILQAMRPPQRLALLLGAEEPGLPETILATSRRVSIPMAPGSSALDSLNVATAGAIALAHVFAARRAPSRADASAP